MHIVHDRIAVYQHNQAVGDKIQCLMLYLAGNPDSPVLGYTKMAFHDGKVCIVQLTRIVEIVRIKGGTGDTCLLYTSDAADE